MSAEFADLARKEAEVLVRSLEGPVGHWAIIGRAIERSDRFDYQRVVQALAAQIPVDDLTGFDLAVYETLHRELMRRPGKGEQDALDRQLQELRASGIDSDSQWD